MLYFETVLLLVAIASIAIEMLLHQDAMKTVVQMLFTFRGAALETFVCLFILFLSCLSPKGTQSG